MLFSSSAGAASAPARAIIVFGDSLSDIGNAGGGRFSNGPVWVEHLAGRLGTRLAPAAAGGTNFAFGGARAAGGVGSPSLRVQADAFLRERRGRADPRALYVVYGGGNDLLAAVNALDPLPEVAEAARAIGAIVADLAAAGAREFLVPNLPDVGRVPEVRWQGADVVQAATRLAVAFNRGLAEALDAAAAERALRLHRLDVWALLERVVADPAAAGFVNITEPCLMNSLCRDPDRFLFWDSVHPTAAAHARLAEAALRVMESPRPRGGS